jgi:hypothetical protein
VNNKINAKRREIEKKDAEIEGVTFKPKLPERKKTTREGNSDDVNIYERLNSPQKRSLPHSPLPHSPLTLPRSSSATRASSDEMNERFKVHIYIYVYTYICVYIYVYTYIDICVCIYVYV